ncbi:hypothetical protein [Ottowia sp.]|uniref:hypothetical protein n=1 Tax=Ottowia sp. TaxID=1898956 RepID=UPI003A898E90
MTDLAAPPKRARSQKIANPATFFAHWAFAIERQHWELLGLSYRQFVLDLKPYYSWATFTPARLNFDEGTVFRRGDTFLQVVFSSGDGMVEVHEGRVGQDAETPVHIVDGKADLSTAFGVRRNGWLMREAGLARWLETGVRPADAVPLHMGNSSCSGLLRMALNPAPD